MEIFSSENMTKTTEFGLIFCVNTTLIFVLLIVLFYPQEQPGLHAHEAVTNKGEQVHPGPEQLPL